MNEQMLKEILTEVKSMKTDMQSMKTDMQSMKTEIQSMKTDMLSMKTDISTIQQTMATKDELAKVSQEMVTKSDIEENTAILRALEHASQVNAAEMEGLKLAVASKESIYRLDTKFDILNERLFEQETADTKGRF